MSVPWLNAFEVALIEEQYETLASLCEEIPDFKDEAALQDASNLVNQALKLSKTEQNNIQETMQKIKKNIQFLARNDVHKLSTHS